jgi:D-alanine-D-alanine ligase
MRIALTYNLRRDRREASAEFDSRETVAAITMLVESLGHHVTALDVTGSIPRVVAGLRWIRPDLVLNLAEGEHGAFREAFYPALFEQLGHAHTGSATSVLALCLDKALAKRVVAAAGIAVAPGALVRGAGAGGGLPRVPLPALVKPNLEGSSKGISAASVVETPDALAARTTELLGRYPDGVLVEQFVPGVDVTVGWIEPLGVLPAIAYRYPSARFAVYDYALKHDTPELVVKQRVEPGLAASIETAAARVFGALGVTGYGRADFRVTPAGEVVFLEMNALPSLAPGEDLYVAAGWLGVRPRELFAHVVQTARQARGAPRVAQA